MTTINVRRELLLGLTIENLGSYFINKYIPRRGTTQGADYLVFEGGQTPPWTLKSRHTTLKSARDNVKNLKSHTT